MHAQPGSVCPFSHICVKTKMLIVQGAYAYFTAKYLGNGAALYDGSFQEWSNASGTQVATGR